MLLLRAAEDRGDAAEAEQQFDLARACARIIHRTGGTPSDLARAAIAFGAEHAEAIAMLVEAARHGLASSPTIADRSRGERDSAIALARIDLPGSLALLSRIPLQFEQDEGMRFIAAVVAERDPDKALGLASTIQDRAMRAMAMAPILAPLLAQRPAEVERLAAAISERTGQASAIRDAVILLASAGDPEAERLAGLIADVPLEAASAFWSIACANALDEATRTRAAARAAIIEETLDANERDDVVAIHGLQRARADFEDGLRITRGVQDTRRASALFVFGFNLDREDLVVGARWSRSGIVGDLGKPAPIPAGPFSAENLAKSHAVLDEAVAQAIRLQQRQEVKRSRRALYRLCLSEGSPASLAEGVRIAGEVEGTAIWLIGDLVKWHTRLHPDPISSRSLAEAIISALT